MKEGTPKNIFKHLNNRTKGVTDSFNSAIDAVNKKLTNELTDKQIELYKAFNSKYLGLLMAGKTKEAEELKKKFENEQF